MMPREGVLLKSVILILAIAMLLLFSSHTAATLFLILAGVVLVAFALQFENRFLALVAVAVLGTEAGFSLRIESVLEIRMLLSAILGVFLPLFLIGNVVLRSGARLGAEKLKNNRHLYITLALTCICMLSVPIAALLMMVFSMTILLNMSALLETSILMVVIVICAVVATAIRPKKKRIRMESTETG